jgi:hypothetical protein
MLPHRLMRENLYPPCTHRTGRTKLQPSIDAGRFSRPLQTINPTSRSDVCNRDRTPFGAERVHSIEMPLLIGEEITHQRHLSTVLNATNVSGTVVCNRDRTAGHFV